MVTLRLALFLSGLLLFSSFLTAGAQENLDRAALLNQIQNLRKQLNDAEAAFLAPAPEDMTLSPGVSGPERKMFRLLPRETYDQSTMLTVREGGAYYSFTRLTHEYGYGSDIELQMGNLEDDFAGADYGFLVSLAETPLEEVSLDTPAVAVLAGHSTPTLLSQARTEQRKASQGFEVNGFSYRDRLPVKVGTPYALRSINYNNSDLLVAFKVLRRDFDGSIVCEWRMLKKYEKPSLQRDMTEGQ
jgi:hypothetical protein